MSAFGTRPPGDGADDRYELLGAYAIDAVDEGERAVVEELLAEDPAAADEVERHRETAAFLAFDVAAAPGGVWDRIADGIEERAPAPGPELAKIMPLTHRRRTRLFGVLAAAAAIVAIAALSVALVRSGGSATTSSQAITQAYEKVAADPASRHVNLTASDGAVEANVVVDPTGTAYVAGNELPRLADDQTYQLWGVLQDGRAISLSVLGPRPDIQVFGMSGALKALAITTEKAGGVVQTVNTPTASATL